MEEEMWGRLEEENKARVGVKMTKSDGRERREQIQGRKKGKMRKETGSECRSEAKRNRWCVRVHARR